MIRVSVRTIVLGGAVMIAIAFVSLGGFGTARAVRSFVVEAALERNQELARQVAIDYEDFLVLHRHAIEAVARQAAAAPRLDMATLHSMLAATNAAFPAMWGVGITDASGRIVAVDPPLTSDGRSAIGIDLSDRAWFRELTRTRAPVIDRDVVTGRVKITPTVTVNVPIVDAGGRLRGAVTGGVDLVRVQELAGRLKIGTTGRANVATSNGRVFAGVPSIVNRDITGSALWGALAGAEAGRVPRYVAADGGERLAAFATVPAAGWKVWVSQELSELDGEVRTAYLSLLWWLPAALGALAVGAIMASVAITRPLRAVQRTAASIAAGDLTRRAPERGPLEIADLAASFNRMADAVRHLVETERDNRHRLELALDEYQAFTTRVARGDLDARVALAGDPRLVEMGHNLNAMAGQLGQQVEAIRRNAEEAARFKRIADQAVEAYFIADERGRLVYVNETACVRLGRSKEELLSRRLDDIDASEPPIDVGRLLARTAQGDHAPFESMHRRSDGTSFPVELSVTAVELDGAPHVFVAARDITRRQRVERQLREETAALETVNEASRMLSGQLDLEALVQGLTDAATRLTGAAFGAFFYNVVDAAGERYTLYALSGAPKAAFERFGVPRNTDLFGPTFRGEGVVRIADVRADPRYGRNAPHQGLPAGHLPVRSYLAVPVVSRSGEVLGGLFFGHPDIGVFELRHERMAVALAAQAAVAMDNARLYEHEQRARAAAEAANRSKDEFLATVSHELRTPLNAILGWTVMLREAQTGRTSPARALEAIERNARAQRQLIEDLLDVSRIVTDKLRLEVAAVDFAACVEYALDAVRPTARAKRLELSAALAPVPVVGDAERLQQIASNLLSNAVKFTPEGGRIAVRLEEADGVAVFVVRDSGSGIAPDVLPHVFERFRQGDSSITRLHGGLGLGLALVRHLTELHGGSVQAESEGLGKGATFTVRLPASTTHAPSRGRSDAGQSGDISLAGIRVLLVDDHADTLDLTAEILARRGAAVNRGANVADAMAAFAEQPPDIVISDIAMPGEDGYALLARIRSLPPSEGGKVPAIALTAHGGRDERVRALAAGFQLHLPKPVDPGELVLAVASLAVRDGTA